MLDKEQKIKSIERPINPINRVRILDWSFPLDMEFLSNPDYVFKHLLYILNFKKIVELVYDKNEKTWEYVFEERFPDSTVIKGYDSMQYYIQWLTSMGNASFYQFAKIIQSYQSSRVRQSDCQYFKNKSNILDLATPQSLNRNERVWISKLPVSLTNEINKKPWIKRISCADLSKKKGNLHSIKINEKYVEVTGSKPSLSNLHDDEDNPLAKIYMRDWINSTVSAFHCVAQGLCGVVARDCVQLIDGNGKNIPGVGAYFSESWVEDDQIWTSVTVSYTLDSQSMIYKSKQISDCDK